MKQFLIYIFFLFSIGSYAQPGPYGGKLEFSFTGKDGQVFKQHSKLRVWPEFEKKSEREYMAGWPATKIYWKNDSTLSYELTPTPMGGILPQGFTIVAVYKKDTMRIHDAALNMYEWRRTIMNRIPFLKGTFRIPEACSLFLNMKWQAGSMPAALDWNNFNVNQAYQPSTAVLQAVTQEEAAGQQTTENEMYRVVNNTRTAAVMHYSDNRHAWDTIISNVIAYPVKAVANNKIAVVTLGHTAFLYSRLPFTTWDLVFYEDPASVDYMEKKYVTIDSVWLKDELIFVKGKKTYPYVYNNIELKDSIFQVHINLSDTSSLYQEIKKDTETKLLAEMKVWAYDFVHGHAVAARKSNLSNSTSPLYQYLDKGRFYDPDGGRLNHLLLTLNNGTFTYNGLNQIDPQENNYANYNSTGTYTYNDSTITFFEAPQYADVVFKRPGVDFIPRGTYYWYFNNNILTLTQNMVVESKSWIGYNLFHAIFWIEK